MRQIRARGETSPSLRDLGTTVCQTPTPKRQGVSVGGKKLSSNHCQLNYAFNYPSIKYNHVQYDVHFNISS